MIKWLKTNLVEAILVIAIAVLLMTSGLSISLTAFVRSKGQQYQIINIGGCQYIRDVTNSKASLVHAGDCTNVVHLK